MTWVCGISQLIICSEVAQMIPGKFPSLGFDIGRFCINCKEPIRCRNRNAFYCSSECKNKVNQNRKKLRRFLERRQS